MTRPVYFSGNTRDVGGKCFSSQRSEAMRRFKATSALATLTVLTVGSCSIEADKMPITGRVSVSVPRLHHPAGSSLAHGVAPIIELETVELYPTLCYRIQYSKRERKGGQVHITLGNAVSTANACADALGPAHASVPIDSTLLRYRLILTLWDGVETYDILIEPDRIRLLPIELHFTFPADSVWMR